MVDKKPELYWKILMAVWRAEIINDIDKGLSEAKIRTKVNSVINEVFTDPALTFLQHLERYIKKIKRLLKTVNCSNQYSGQNHFYMPTSQKTNYNRWRDMQRSTINNTSLNGANFNTRFTS